MKLSFADLKPGMVPAAADLERTAAVTAFPEGGMTAWRDNSARSDAAANRWLLECVDAVASFGTLRPGLADNASVPATLAAARTALHRLLDFHSLAFFAVDQTGLHFPLLHADPDSEAAAISEELEVQVRDGVFASALRLTHPLIVPARMLDGSVMLQALATRSRIAGAFVGVLKDPQPFGRMPVRS